MREAFEAAQHTGVFTFEHRIRSAAGAYRWFLAHAEPHRDPQTGAITRWFGASIDIHDRKNTEAHLAMLYTQEQAARVQAEEASRLKDEFLATVSHELRTPLTAFLGYAELLQRRQHDEAYVSRTVEKMVQSARAQAELIEDLLDISRIVSGKLRLEPTLITLVDVIHAALNTVRPTVEAKELDVQVELDTAAGMVLGDANRLQQVVWNLLANATKFTAPRGRIVVRLATVGRSAELSVSDSGQGIHPDFLRYVFDRFRQADSSCHRVSGGLGLGLAIVRHLVELHGGSVEARSAGVGQGATFTVCLPLARLRDIDALPRSARTDSWKRETRWFPLRGLRALVVDDQPAILDMLTEILVSEGAVVRACATAREALDLVSAWQPDVLVSDIAMPDEDGYWLIREVRGLAPEEGGAIPAVALTAYVRMDGRLRLLAAGFQQYVPKPVDASELCAVILRVASKELGR
jgi:signal transduction histidine kinase